MPAMRWWEDLSDEELVRRMVQREAPSWWAHMAVAEHRAHPHKGYADDIEEVLAR